jgi:hypothetical protein
MKTPKRQGISVEGIVARRDKMPYILLFRDGDPIGQLSMGQARKVAHDILTMCARTEADAMIHKFFKSRGAPDVASAECMLDFRVFRHELDSEPVEGYTETPSGDPPVN